jgi:hypothetical protein
MINIVIIEDKKDQLDDIIFNVNDLLLEFKLMSKYRDTRFKIIPIDTRIQLIHHSEGVELQINELLSRVDPHILIVDYDLEWSKERYVFDGDRIVELIEKNIKINPFIILASSQFEHKKHPSVLVDSGRIPASAKWQINKGSFMDEWGKDSPKRRDVKDLLIKGIDYIESLRLKFKVFRFPDEEYLLRNQKTPYELMLDYRKEEKSLHAISLRSDQIVSIVLGYRYTYALIIYSSTGNLIIFCCHFVHNLGKSEVLNKYEFLKDGPGMVYNPKYLEYVASEFRFKTEAVNLESIKRFNSKICATLRVARLYETKFVKYDLDIKNIHPMCAPLLRFQGID